MQSFLLNFFDVDKTFSQLLFGASLSARDMLCSSMLEISILHVSTALLANIYVTHVTFSCVKKRFTSHFL